jgi:hypothetical protein
MTTQYDLEEMVQEQVSTVPVDYMADSVYHYVLFGREVGDFLMALISNDLTESVSRADETNLSHLVDWVRWFYNVPTGRCWGSPEKLKHWQKIGGLVGLYAAELEVES